MHGERITHEVDGVHVKILELSVADVSLQMVTDTILRTPLRHPWRHVKVAINPAIMQVVVKVCCHS